jgi:hypothetical protein
MLPPSLPEITPWSPLRPLRERKCPVIPSFNAAFSVSKFRSFDFAGLPLYVILGKGGAVIDHQVYSVFVSDMGLL